MGLGFGRSLSRFLMGGAAAVLFGLPALAAGHARPSLYDPALSPDGREIAFVSGGDIWTVPAAGGVAQLLVSHPATEGRPLLSPDATRLAFTSTREGQPTSTS